MIGRMSRHQRHPAAGKRVVKVDGASAGAGSLGAGSAGALAIGALAGGAVAIGALAIGRLAIGRASIRHLRIEELEVGRLRVRELEVTEPGRAGTIDWLRAGPLAQPVEQEAFKPSRFRVRIPGGPSVWRAAAPRSTVDPVMETIR